MAIESVGNFLHTTEGERMSCQTMMIGQQTTLSTGAVVAAYRVGDDRTLFRFQSAGSETAVALTDEAVEALVKMHKGVSE